MWPILSCLVIHSFRRASVRVMLVCTIALIWKFTTPDIPMNDLARGDLFPTTLAFSCSLVLALFVTLQELPMEMYSRFHLILLSKPISRTGYLMGKICGIFLFGAISLAVTSIAAYAFMVAKCEFSVPIIQNLVKPFVHHMLFMWLFSVAAGITGAFLSEAFCLMITSIALAGSLVIGIIPSILQKEVSVGSTLLLKVVYYILPNFGYFQPGQYQAYPATSLLLLLVYTAGYTGLVLPLAIRNFNKISFA